MKLHTQIKLKMKDDNQIDYHSKLLLLGSCFSENIGNKFDYFKFQKVSNPFGILFHIKAIENLIIRALNQKKYTEKELFFYNEQWHCYDAHSKLSNPSKAQLLKNLNASLNLTQQQIQESTHIVFTLGTAWVYDVLGSNKTVASCHKTPQNQFNKRLLSVAEIVKSIKTILEVIKQKNKLATVIFTVSPVRHIKDGFIENTLSKSHLISAIHQVLKTNVNYFPSYEIMFDELRDYRFYKSDMLHPNQTAINYIWQRFQEVWVSSEAQKTMDEVDVVQKGLMHKPFNETAVAHKQFINKLNLKQEALSVRFSFMSFIKPNTLF